MITLVGSGCSVLRECDGERERGQEVTGFVYSRLQYAMVISVG